MIPEAAVEAAIDAFVGAKGTLSDHILAILAAAAPHMEAQALREAADALEAAAQWSAAPNPEFEKIRRWLRARAASFERPTT